jgi:hypothetical protein
MADNDVRDLASIRLSKWGRVGGSEGVVPWRFVDDGGRPVEPVCRFLVRGSVSVINPITGR